MEFLQYLLISTYIQDPIAVEVRYDSTTLQTLKDYDFALVYCASDWIDRRKVAEFPELENKTFFAFLLSFLDAAELYESFDTGQQYYHVDHWVRYLIGLPYDELVNFEKLQNQLGNSSESVKEWQNYKKKLKPFLEKNNFSNLREFFFYLAVDHGSENMAKPEWRLIRYGRICGVYKSDPNIDYLFTADGRADYVRYFYHNISNSPPNAEDVDITVILCKISKRVQILIKYL